MIRLDMDSPSLRPNPASLWHQDNSHVVNKLINSIQHASSTSFVGRNILKQLLPLLLSEFQSKLDANFPDDESKLPEKSSSSRVKAAKVILFALNYSLCIENSLSRRNPKEKTKNETILLSSKSIKLLCLITLIYLMKTFSTETTVQLLQLEYAQKTENEADHEPYSSILSTKPTTIIDAILRSILSILDSSTLQAESHQLFVSKAIDCVNELINHLMKPVLSKMKSDKGERGHRAILIAFVFVRGLLKGMHSLARKDLSDDTVKAMISVYTKLITALPLSNFASKYKISNKIFTTPLHYSKHIINHILFLALKSDSRDVSSHSISCLHQAELLVRKHTSALKEYKFELHAIANCIALMPVLLSSHLDRRDSPKDLNSPSRAFFDGLLQWATHCSVKVVRLLLFSLLEHLISFTFYWQDCENVVLGLYNSKLDEESERIGDSFESRMTEREEKSMVQVITEWLISCACHRDATTKHSEASVITTLAISPSNIRLFSIKVLALLPNGNQQITVSLQSLFDDPSNSIRHAVAEYVAIRCLNSEHTDRPGSNCNIKLQSVSDTLDHLRIVHRSDGSCFVEGADRLVSGYDLRAEVRVRNIFDGLLAALDSLKDNRSEPNTIQAYRERHSFRLWTMYIMMHFHFRCPFIMSNDDRNGVSLNQQKVLWTDLIKALEYRVKTFTNTSSIHFLLAICGILSGLLRSSSDNPDRLSDSKPNLDPCLLKLSLSLIWNLRNHSSWRIRLEIIRVLAECVGLSIPFTDDPDNEVIADDEKLLKERTMSQARHLFSTLSIHKTYSLMYDLIQRHIASESSSVHPHNDTVDSHPLIHRYLLKILKWGQYKHDSYLSLRGHFQDLKHERLKPVLRGVKDFQNSISGRNALMKSVGSAENIIRKSKKKVVFEHIGRDLSLSETLGLAEESNIQRDFPSTTQSTSSSPVSADAFTVSPTLLSSLSNKSTSKSKFSKSHLEHLYSHNQPSNPDVSVELKTVLQENLSKLRQLETFTQRYIQDVEKDIKGIQNIKERTEFDSDHRGSNWNFLQNAEPDISGMNVRDDLDIERKLDRLMGEIENFRNSDPLEQQAHLGDPSYRREDWNSPPFNETIDDVELSLIIEDDHQAQTVSHPDVEKDLSHEHSNSNLSRHQIFNRNKGTNVDDHEDFNLTFTDIHPLKKHLKADQSYIQSPKTVGNVDLELDGIEFDVTGGRTEVEDILNHEVRPRTGASNPFEKDAKVLLSDFERRLADVTDGLHLKTEQEQITKQNIDRNLNPIQEQQDQQEFNVYDSINQMSQHSQLLQHHYPSFSLLNLDSVIPLIQPPTIQSRTRKMIDKLLNTLAFDNERYGSRDPYDNQQKDEEEISEEPKEIFENLHPLLKKVFKLDPTLLVEMCSNVSLDVNTSQLGSVDEVDWLHNIRNLHQHLLPVSHILWDLDDGTRSPTSLAQAVVIVKDQIVLSKRAMNKSLLHTGNSILMSSGVGKAGRTGTSGLAFKETSEIGFPNRNHSFLDWIDRVDRSDKGRWSVGSTR